MRNVDWATCLALATAIANVLLGIKLHRSSQSLEREKLKHGRGDSIFRRQLEALDEVAGVVAEPIGIAARTTWDPKVGVVLLGDVNLEASTDNYLRIAGKHFYVIGPAMVHLVDELQARGWEILFDLMSAKDEGSFWLAADRMMKHRFECLEFVDSYLHDRVSEATLKGSDDGAMARKLKAMASIEYALPQIRARRPRATPEG